MADSVKLVLRIGEAEILLKPRELKDLADALWESGLERKVEQELRKVMAPEVIPNPPTRR